MNKKLIPILICFALISCKKTIKKPTATVIVHGGAGNTTTDMMNETQVENIRAAIQLSLEKSQAHIANGGTSVEAVQIAVNILENSECFNAGKGAVFTAEGKHELDASIMNGSNRKAGAVAGLTNIKNPIDAAIAVMEYPPTRVYDRKGCGKFFYFSGIRHRASKLFLY